MHIRWEIDYIVSTHSRPKAAAMEIPLTARVDDVSTHSRPKAAAKEQIKQKIAEMFQHTAARRRLHLMYLNIIMITRVSTHSRPKAAAKKPIRSFCFKGVSTHSRPKAAA